MSTIVYTVAAGVDGLHYFIGFSLLNCNLFVRFFVIIITIITGEPLHMTSKEFRQTLHKINCTTERVPQLSINEMRSGYSASFPPAKVKNSMRSTSAINPVTQALKPLMHEPMPTQ